MLFCKNRKLQHFFLLHRSLQEWGYVQHSHRKPLRGNTHKGFHLTLQSQTAYHRTEYMILKMSEKAGVKLLQQQLK